MIPLSRVLARISGPTGADAEAAPAPYPAEHAAAVQDTANISSPWNPTGNIFDLRPDLAHMPMAQLAGALLEMRQLLCSREETINRLQLMRFERQYSNALWRRASTENVESVTIKDTIYRLLLTDGMDVVLLPAA